MFDNKSILITGGTGSFGKKLSKTILQKYNPERLIIFSRDELKQFEMREQFPQDQMRFFIGDVRDAERVKQAFRGVDLVIHAAAMKQVPPGVFPLKAEWVCLPSARLLCRGQKRCDLYPTSLLWLL